MDKEKDWTITDSILWFVRRDIRGITNKDIARACEVSEGTVSLWMKSDGGEIRMKHIYKIAALLQIPIERLFKGVTTR
jgi:transcriptional regulator with XRE-family HTH domain